MQDFSLNNVKSQDERERKAKSMLGDLKARGLEERVLKDQIVAVLVGGRVREGLYASI